MAKDPQLKQSEADARDARRKALHNRWKDRSRPNAAALELVREACADGATVLSICSVLGISDWTFRAWREKYPEFDAVVRQGRAIEHDVLTNKLTEMAKAGNIAALALALKARHNWNDTGTGNAVVQNKVQITFQLPDSLSPKQYLERLAATATVMKPEEVTRVLAQPGVKGKLLKHLALERREDSDGQE